MFKTLTNRWTTAFALGAISLASLAPMAQAGHDQGGGRKFRGEDGGRGFQGMSWRGHDAWRGGGHFDRGFRGGRVIVHQHSSIGPAFAGLVGGLVLGSALSHAAPVREHVVYRDRVVYDDGGGYPAPNFGDRDVFFVDPSCGERFDSFGACSDYLSYEHHPRVIDVVDSRSGNVVQRFAYENDAWREVPFDDDDDN